MIMSNCTIRLVIKRLKKTFPLSIYDTTYTVGDFYPTSTLGRFVAVIAAYLGIVGIALPSTIIGKSFIEIYFR